MKFLRFLLAFVLLAQPVLAQLAPPTIPPPITGSETVTCLRSGSPYSCTTAGIAGLAGTLGNQAANRVLAGPVSGGAALPAYRPLVGADIPAINLAAGGAGGITGILGVSNGGTNTSTASGTALDNITGFSGTGFMSRTGAGAYSFGNTATTQAVANNSTQIATTAYVDRATGYPVYPFNAYGGDPTGTNNNDSAFAALVTLIGTNEGCITMGAGTYKFASAINVTLNQTARNSFCLRGAGQNVTIMDWANANGGVAVALQGQENSVQISDLGLWTGQVGGGTGIRLTNAGAFGGGDGNASNIERVWIGGDDKTRLHDSNLHYWNDGVIETAVSNINLTGVSIVGAGLTGLGDGLTVQGISASATFSVSVNVTQCFFYGLGIGINFGTYFQGLMVSQSTFVSGQRGIVEGAGAVGTDQLQVVNNEFNTASDQILVNQMTHLIVEGNLFFLIAANSSGISYQGGQQAIISGNAFNGPTPTIANINGIFVNTNFSTGAGVITGNTFYDMDKAVWLNTTSTNWNVQANAYKGNNTNVLNSAGSANSVGVATQ